MKRLLKELGRRISKFAVFIKSIFRIIFFWVLKKAQANWKCGLKKCLKFFFEIVAVSLLFYYLGTDLKLAAVPDKKYGREDAPAIVKKDNEDLFLNVVSLTPGIWATSVDVSLDFISVFQKNENTSQI